MLTRMLRLIPDVETDSDVKKLIRTLSNDSKVDTDSSDTDSDATDTDTDSDTKPIQRVETDSGC